MPDAFDKPYGSDPYSMNNMQPPMHQQQPQQQICGFSKQQLDQYLRECDYGAKEMQFSCYFKRELGTGAPVCIVCGRPIAAHPDTAGGMATGQPIGAAAFNPMLAGGGGLGALGLLGLAAAMNQPTTPEGVTVGRNKDEVEVDGCCSTTYITIHKGQGPNSQMDVSKRLCCFCCCPSKMVVKIGDLKGLKLESAGYMINHQPVMNVLAEINNSSETILLFSGYTLSATTELMNWQAYLRGIKNGGWGAESERIPHDPYAVR